MFFWPDLAITNTNSSPYGKDFVSDTMIEDKTPGTLDRSLFLLRKTESVIKFSTVQ